MDYEDNSLQFIERTSKLNNTYPFNEYKAITKNDKFTNGPSNKIRINSCDNFQNVLVSFESNSSTNAVSTSPSVLPQKGYLEPLEYNLSSSGWAGVSENIGLNIIERMLEANNWEQGDIEPLHYLVYQHYFNTPSLLQRVIEKSKNLFRSNCNAGVTLEYSKSRSFFPLKGNQSRNLCNFPC